MKVFSKLCGDATTTGLFVLKTRFVLAGSATEQLPDLFASQQVAGDGPLSRFFLLHESVSLGADQLDDFGNNTASFPLGSDTGVSLTVLVDNGSEELVSGMVSGLFAPSTEDVKFSWNIVGSEFVGR